MSWAAVWLLITVVSVFVVIRVSTDAANLISGALPGEDSFDRRYAERPWLAYLHIVPGIVYLGIAPSQISARSRNASLGRHRRRGRVVLVSGLITGGFALAVGLVMPFGNLAEASATAVFGVYFLVSLSIAYRAIRTGDIATHRRWMLRAFAIGVGVGMIRVVVGLATSVGIGIDRSFGAAFWIAFAIMAISAETWLHYRPLPPV